MESGIFALIIKDRALIVSMRPTRSDLGCLWVLGAERFSRIPSFLINISYYS